MYSVAAAIVMVLLPALGETVDLVVFGATPGGVMTAIAAARNGADAVLVEPSWWIGGLLTGGLSHSVRAPRLRTMHLVPPLQLRGKPRVQRTCTHRRISAAHKSSVACRWSSLSA